MDSFLGALDDYLDAARRERGLSQATLQRYRHDLKLFAQWSTLQDLVLSQVQSADILAFLANIIETGHSAGDASRILARLRQFFAYQHQLGRVDNDPTAGIST